jgi:small conductance mechanosensitive channel
VTRAEEIALRVNGVVTVENQIERRLAVEDSSSPIFGDPSGRLQKVYRALPLYGVSLGVFLLIALLGHLLASWRGFWRLILPNSFLMELVSGAFRDRDAAGGADCGDEHSRRDGDDGDDPRRGQA